MADASIRVVVADDQTIVREGMATLLSLLPGIEVVGQASNGADAVALVASTAPDVVLMDLRMPEMDGVEATRRIRADYPATQVLVLTTFSDEGAALDALQAGALGFLTKDAAAADIAQGIRTVASGHALVDADVQRRLIETAARAATPPSSSRPATDALPDGLTAREGEILTLIAAGLSNAEIADRLFVGEATVKTHINRIFAKIGARDRAQAVRYAYRSGLAD